jgi:hypothetical protein
LFAFHQLADPKSDTRNMSNPPSEEGAPEEGPPISSPKGEPEPAANSPPPAPPSETPPLPEQSDPSPHVQISEAPPRTEVSDPPPAPDSEFSAVDASVDHDEADESNLDSVDRSNCQFISRRASESTTEAVVASDLEVPAAHESSVQDEEPDDKSAFDGELASNEEEPTRTSSYSRTVSEAIEEKPRPKPVSSVVSLLVDAPDGDSRPPTPRSTVVIKKAKPIIDILNQGSPKSVSAPVSKIVAPACEVRRREPPKLPEWQSNIATTFLLTADMSFADDEHDIEHPVDRATPDVDQITEETTKCICNSTHESEVMIQCDSCSKWLHEDCVKLQNSRESDPFICLYCQQELVKAVKLYMRKKLGEFKPILQKMRAEAHYRQGMRPTSIWHEILEIVKDSQEVLKMIPFFLPNNDESHPPDLPASVFG